MKKITTCIIIIAITLLPFKGISSGGPDAYGYTWITSVDAGGPVFSWIDITTRAGVQTVTGLADDNSAPSMSNIGFPFHYYWSDYTQFKVGSNGWVSFNNTSNIASCFPTIPAAGGPSDNYMALLMGDLNFTGAGNPGQVKYWTNNVDTCIISYINVPFWSVNSPGWTGSNSFQVILAASDSSITFQYGALSGFAANAGCVDLTIGIENSTGGVGLQVHSDVMPPSNYVIRYDYPATVLLSIQDEKAQWNANTKNKAEFILKDFSYPLLASYRNSGNTNIATSSDFQATVINSAAATVHSTTSSIPTFAAGDDTTITFPLNWTPTISGQYTFQSTLSNSSDINSSNNTNNTELEVVDACAANMLLNYVGAGIPDGSLNWNGGANDDGAAVYFKPPVYPYTVSALQYYISSNVSDGYYAQVYDDDGLDGAPGTLLFTSTVSSASVVSAAWNTVTVSPAVTLNSGGFYVAWIQGGTTIFLGTGTATPLSHQNYEILDGAWATLRYDDSRDVYIRATITGFSGVPVANYTSASSLLNTTFTNTTAGPVTSYAWDFGDAQTSTLQNPSHTYSADGTYNVCLTSTSPCGSDTECQTVTVCSLPVAAYISSASSLNVTFTDMSSANATSWSWDFGDGGTSTLQSPLHTYAADGTYNACLISTSACGSDTVCQTVTVCAPVIAAYTSTDAFLNVSFTDGSVGSAVSWTWDFGDGNTSTVQNPSHTYAASGTYTVCLITSSSCANDTVCQMVSVCDQVMASYNSLTTFLNVDFTDNSTGSAASWSWDFGDAGTSTLQNPSHTYAANGTYNVCLIATSACASDTMCQMVTVCDSSIPAFNITQTTDSVFLTDTSSGTINSWFWDFGDGDTSIVQNVAHMYTAPGVYSVCLTIVNDCGSSTTCQSVTIVATSIAENNQAIMNSYPNPVADLFNIQLQQGLQHLTIEIFDVTGKCVGLKKDISEERVSMDVSTLSSGLYMLKLNHASGSSTLRFIKE
jgi:PKD repeat protein